MTNGGRGNPGEESIGGDSPLSGFFSVLGFQFLELVLSGVSGAAWLASGLGFVQLLYVVPMMRLARRRGYRRFGAGVIAGALLGALLNVAWWLLAA